MNTYSGSSDIAPLTLTSALRGGFWPIYRSYRFTLRTRIQFSNQQEAGNKIILVAVTKVSTRWGAFLSEEGSTAEFRNAVFFLIRRWAKSKRRRFYPWSVSYVWSCYSTKWLLIVLLSYKTEKPPSWIPPYRHHTEMPS